MATKSVILPSIPVTPTEAKKPYIGAPYVIHEVECICENPYTGALGPASPSFSFEVFQLVNEDGEMLPGVFKCDNCGRKWKVSEVGGDNDMMDMNAPLAYDKEGMKARLNPKISVALEMVQAPTSKYAWAFWVCAYKKWGSSIVIGKKPDDKNPEVIIARQLTIHAVDSIEVKDIKASMDVNVDMRKR